MIGAHALKVIHLQTLVTLDLMSLISGDIVFNELSLGLVQIT